MQRLLHAIADGQCVSRRRLAPVLELVAMLAACARGPEPEDGTPTSAEAEAPAATGDYPALGEYNEAQDTREPSEVSAEVDCPRGSILVCQRIGQFKLPRKL